MKIRKRVHIYIIVSAMLVASATSLVDTMGSFISNVKAEVLRVQPKCSDLVTTVQSSFECISYMTPTLPSRSYDSLETHFYIHLLQNSSADLAWIPAPTLHYKPCSLLLFDVSTLFRQADNYSLDYNNWPIVPYAGSFHTSYFLFFAGSPNEIPDFEELLLSFTKTTRKLQNVFFVVSQSDGELDIFARSAFADRLTQISEYSRKGSFTSGTHFLDFRISFHGAPMIATVCPICDKPIEVFERTGMWNDYLSGTMYELACFANATLELAAAFGAPRTGLTLEGDWDEFVMPLIDGSGVITQLLEPSVYNRKFVFSSSPMFFDNVAFITDHPKRLRFTSLARLSAPLRLNVWIAIGLSFVFVFIALEIIIEVYRKLKYERRARGLNKTSFDLSPIEKSLIWEAIPDHRQHWTAFALVSSALDQCAIFSGPFAKNIDGNASRLLFSLWYLMLIVIGCAYKSDLTSSIVRPVYIQPPTTFTELIESDYKIGVVFYSEGGLEANFAAMNNSVSRAIQARHYEYEFLEPDCYVRILKEKAVCISTLTAVPLLTKTFLIDIHGRPMYMFSKEKLFPLIMNFGLSMMFPSLLAPLNFFVGWFTCTGVYAKWQATSVRDIILDGKIAARKTYDKDRLYGGEEVDDGSEAYSKVMLNIQVLCLGYMVSAVFFLFEVLGVFRRWLKTNRFVVTRDFTRPPSSGLFHS